MKNTKVFQIILHFNDKELKKLSKFVHSPYFNTENNVKMLFDYILANKTNIRNKELAFKYLYPNEKYNNSRMRYLTSTLYNLIKKYIEFEYLQKNKSVFQVSFLKKLRKIDQKHLYELEENKIVQKPAFNTIIKSIDYQKKYLFEFERLEFYAEQKRTETKYLESIHYNLDAYYFIEKLKTTCTSINQQKLYNTENSQSFFKPLIEYIENTKMHLKIPLLNIYYNAYKMLISNEVIFFRNLKTSIENSKLETIEIKDAYFLALNFCIQQINSGNTSFNNEMFEMYQTGIEKEILLKQGKLSAITFSNVITIGLRLKRYKEVENFIENNKNLLSGTEKKSYYTFNIAKVYFEKGEFEKVTELYNEKLIKEILLNIQMRILQIKAFYELEEFDICESLVLSTDQLLNRKGILAYHKLVFKNFIKAMKQLLVVNSFDKNAVKKLETMIQKEKIIEKEWLLKKIN